MLVDEFIEEFMAMKAGEEIGVPAEADATTGAAAVGILNHPMALIRPMDNRKRRNVRNGFNLRDVFIRSPYQNSTYHIPGSGNFLKIMDTTDCDQPCHSN